MIAVYVTGKYAGNPCIPDVPKGNTCKFLDNFAKYKI